MILVAHLQPLCSIQHLCKYTVWHIAHVAFVHIHSFSVTFACHTASLCVEKNMYIHLSEMINSYFIARAFISYML